MWWEREVGLEPAQGKGTEEVLSTGRECSGELCQDSVPEVNAMVVPVLQLG